MSLVAFQAQNHPQQPTKDSVDDRRTLPDLFGSLHAQRQFTVDAAASADNALLPRYWTRETDGLAQSWRGERVWCNPPYSAIGPWVVKAWTEMRLGGCDLVVMLLPGNRCEQRWWQLEIEPWRDDDIARDGVYLITEFLSGRMRFDKPDSVEWPSVAKKGNRPPFGCVLVTWERSR